MSITIKNLHGSKQITHVLIQDLKDSHNGRVVYDEDVSIAPGGQATYSVTIETVRSGGGRDCFSFNVTVTTTPPLDTFLGGYYVHLYADQKPMTLEFRSDENLDNPEIQ